MKPCGTCPFRKDQHFLTKERAKDIANAIRRDGHFSCHKTVRYDTDDGQGRVTKDSKLCTGSLIVSGRDGLCGQMARIQGRLGLLDGEALDKAIAEDPSTYASLNAFIKGHTPKRDCQSRVKSPS